MTTLSTINPTLLALRIDEPSMLSIDCASGNVRLLIDELGGTPDGVQVDLERGLVYWTNMGADYHAEDGTVEVAKLDGSGRRVLVGRGSIRTPKQLCLDRAAEQLYWCDREGAAIWRSDVDGANLTKLVDRAIEPGGRDEVLNQCVGIAVDHKHGMFVWTQKGPAKGGKGRIFHAGVGHAAGRFRRESQRHRDSAKRSSRAHRRGNRRAKRSALLDGSRRGARRQFVEQREDHGERTIGRRVICTGFKEAIGLALDIPNHCAYVADLDGDVVKVDLASGAKETLIKEDRITGIALI